MAFGILLGVLVGLAAATYFARQRRNSWSASNTDGGAKSRVTLIAGPFAGKTVTVDGLPTNGSSLTSWTWGLVGHDVHRGSYVVVDADASTRTASAAWKLDR